MPRDQWALRAIGDVPRDPTLVIGIKDVNVFILGPQPHRGQQGDHVALAIEDDQLFGFGSTGIKARRNRLEKIPKFCS